MEALEGVQRWVIRMMPELVAISYSEVGQTWIVFSGMPEVTGRPDRSV